MRAETLKFQEKGVNEVVKQVFLPWFNAYRFFVQNALRFGDVWVYLFIFIFMFICKKNYLYLFQVHKTPFAYDAALSLTSTNVMDKWILAACHGLLQFIQQEMKGTPHRFIIIQTKTETFPPCSLQTVHSGAPLVDVHRPADQLVRSPQPPPPQGQ